MIFDSARMKLRDAGFRDLAIHLLAPGQGIDLATRKLLP